MPRQSHIGEENCRCSSTANLDQVQSQLVFEVLANGTFMSESLALLSISEVCSETESKSKSEPLVAVRVSSSSVDAIVYGSDGGALPACTIFTIITRYSANVARTISRQAEPIHRPRSPTQCNKKL